MTLTPHFSCYAFDLTEMPGDFERQLTKHTLERMGAWSIEFLREPEEGSERLYVTFMLDTENVGRLDDIELMLKRMHQGEGLLPRIDGKDLKEGDSVNVRVGEKLYEARIDRKVLRFVENWDHPLASRLRNRGDGTFNEDGDILDLNEMVMRFHRGEFDEIDMMEMYIFIGYSVSGFNSLQIADRFFVDCPTW